MKDKELEEAAKKVVNWFKSAYSDTTNEVDLVMINYFMNLIEKLCDRVEDLETQLEGRAQYGIDWE